MTGNRSILGTRKRRQPVDSAILDAAELVFGRKGYQQTTMEMLAREAGQEPKGIAPLKQISADTPEHPLIIPQPVQARFTGGRFPLSGATTVLIGQSANAKDARAAEVIAEWIERKAGFRPRIERVLTAEQRSLKGRIVVGETSLNPASGKLARQARKLAANDPLTLLLDAQAAQLAGDHDGARRAFHSMAAREQTRLLGLRGLFIEAQRMDDPLGALAAAEEAARLSPSSNWASQAVLGFRCAGGDSDGALNLLDHNHPAGLLNKVAYQRQPPVLLTAQALARAETDTAAAPVANT